MADADALSRLHVAQERMDLEAELASAGDGGVDLEALEGEFIQAVGPYSQRKGVSYDARRAAGVEPGSLRPQVSVAASRRSGGTGPPPEAHLRVAFDVPVNAQDTGEFGG